MGRFAWRNKHSKSPEMVAKDSYDVVGLDLQWFFQILEKTKTMERISKGATHFKPWNLVFTTTGKNAFYNFNYTLSQQMYIAMPINNLSKETQLRWYKFNRLHSPQQAYFKCPYFYKNNNTLSSFKSTSILFLLLLQI